MFSFSREVPLFLPVWVSKPYLIPNNFKVVSITSYLWKVYLLLYQPSIFETEKGTSYYKNCMWLIRTKDRDQNIGYVNGTLTYKSITVLTYNCREATETNSSTLGGGVLLSTTVKSHEDKCVNRKWRKGVESKIWDCHPDYPTTWND